MLFIFFISVIAISITALYITNKNKEYDLDLYSQIYKEYDEVDTTEEDYTTMMNVDEEVIKKITERKQLQNVIGKIKIDKINIEYPILAETTDELMKIAPTKYCGPRPNGVGNLVIIGHNFYDGTLFSDLNKLTNGDVVEITDISSNTVKYTVYEKKIIEPDDFTPTYQDVKDKCIITLITCINGTDNRLVVKCREEI